MVLPPVDHECSLQKVVTDLAGELAKLSEQVAKLAHENAQLKKSMYGARTERSKLPRVKTAEPVTPEQVQEPGARERRPKPKLQL